MVIKWMVTFLCIYKPHYNLWWEETQNCWRIQNILIRLSSPLSESALHRRDEREKSHTSARCCMALLQRTLLNLNMHPKTSRCTHPVNLQRKCVCVCVRQNIVQQQNILINSLSYINLASLPCNVNTGAIWDPALPFALELILSVCVHFDVVSLNAFAVLKLMHPQSRAGFGSIVLMCCM